MTNEEVRNDCIQRMGLRLGLIFHRLQAEFLQLLERWRPFKSLYGSDPARLEILNAADRQFFGGLQSVMWESMLLGIARLVDDHAKVVSLARIPTFLPDTNEREELGKKLKQVIKDCRFAIVWRNNYIAHRSEKLIFEKDIYVLPQARRVDVETALDSIGDFLSQVDVIYGGNPTMWKFYREDFTNPLNLHFRLSDGLRNEQARKRRFKDGTYTRDDIEQRAQLWVKPEKEDK